MAKESFCKTGFIALLLLGAVVSRPLQEADEAITVPAIQFRSKTSAQDICTAYLVQGQLFITLSRCLGEDRSAINQLSTIDVVGQGTRKIQAFAIRGPEAEASADIAVVMYDGPLEKQSDRSGLFAAFRLHPVARFEREDEAEGAATALDLDSRLIGSLAALFGSMYLAK
ncbi:uncharacterized protein LOC129780565 [Toxorhynchites rutilus septentrionalis]|uniref:uncharacterized protein LOC129780565 n=1 Tax=Toxorhynchites rutilus septentrionalis TaxID=329112 RepID=UPI002479B85C|nr:uncharacterized protein LOC129780565 [Toxorhynchites rutilus septentrionalis]